MTIEEMKKRKQELGYTNATLSARTGIPIGTLQKIFSGETKAPRKSTIDALLKVLGNKEPAYTLSAKEHLFIMRDSARAGSQYSCDRAYDPAAEYKRKYGCLPLEKHFTIDDYRALPDDQRVELIDGVFYDMAAPSSYHQIIAGAVHHAFMSHVRANKGSCMPMISPVDVQLDCDNDTMIQPDVLIICDKSKIRYANVYGAPDFVMEILSPSTRKKDMQLKYSKYEDAGVREYWVVDPDSRKIIVYDLENMSFPTIYTFDDEVPVGIWGGACKVDFKEIAETLDMLNN
ncbi:MAG: Uma2 family endonuclease [Eubacteriales bacterium]|nr:Uma2 family endonuclease [Eubacteriales bacterium]